MSTEEQKEKIKLQRYYVYSDSSTGFHSDPHGNWCDFQEVEELEDRLATSEEKVKQLSAELKIAERQIKELIIKIK